MIPSKRLPQNHLSVKDLKSVSDVKEKASSYKSTDETKRLVKQAILQELNSHLMSIKPQVIHQKNHQSSASGRRGTKSSKTLKAPKIEVERHFSQPLSRIPRPISDVTNITKHNFASPIVKSRAVKLPGYDWDKKGRISELRTRYIARKYLTMWLKKVFGRVSPCHARKHYEKRLTRSAFHTIEDLWWNSRKGWKLNIRAEYHNRYRIWKRMFKAWRLYVVYTKQKAVKTMIANKFDEMNCTKKAFLAMRIYFESRNHKKDLNKRADELRESVLKRFSLRKWFAMNLSSQTNRNLEAKALRFWAYNVKSRAFTKWNHTKDLKDIENQKLRLAKNHYNGLIVKKCLIAFQSYVLTCRKKQKIKDFAEHHYNQTLRQRTIKIWYGQLQHILEIKELEERIIFMARKFTIRTSFTRWVYHIADVKVFEEKISIADNHKNRQLKVKYFHALKIAAERKRLKVERNIKADKFRITKILTLYWNQWLLRCENSEELKLYPLTKIARVFYRKNRLKESLVQWWYYVRWRRKRKHMYAKADEHHKNVALPKYFWRLHNYTEIRKEKNERKIVADDFNKELRYARSFYTWLKNSRLQQNLRMLERMAILQNEETCIRKTLMKWRTATKAVLIEKSKEDSAEEFREQTLKRKYFNFLRKNLEDEKARRLHVMMAVEHDSKKVLRMVFKSWQKFTTQQMQKHRKTEIANEHYKKVILSKCMSLLKAYTDDRKIIYREVHRREELHRAILSRWTFQRWYENANELSEEKSKLEMAYELWKRTTLTKILNCWREYTALKNHKQQIMQSRLEQLTVELNHGKLHRAFDSMKAFTITTKKKKHLQQVAVEFNERRLKIKYISEWKCFVALSFRKLLLQRQSLHFHATNCMKLALNKWKNQLEKSLHEKNRTYVALWWWSRNLQRKVLYAWVDYVVINKKNKQRVAKALELRRNWMLENCLTRWFEYSSDMIAFRTKISQARQLEGNIKLHERVRKYAMVWYRKSKKSKKEMTANQALGSMDIVRNVQETDSSLELKLPDVTERYTATLGIPVIQQSHRPMPRKPDYLRDSYDLNLLFTTSNEISRENQNQHIDESQPRLPPPEPQFQTRLQKHPLDRSKRNDSIDFPASSEDGFQKDESEQSDRQKSHFIKRRVEEKKIILLPPSSFLKLATNQNANGSQSALQNKNINGNASRNSQREDDKDEPKSPSNKVNYDKDIDDQSSQTNGCSENGYDFSAGMNNDDDDEDDDDNDDCDDNYDDEDDDDDESLTEDEKLRLFAKISAIKENLKRYQHHQNRYKELESRCLQLSKWMDVEQNRQTNDELLRDLNYQQALVLSNELKEEMEHLSLELEKKKPIVTQMAKTIKELTCKLNANE